MTLYGIDALNPPPSAVIKAAGKSFVVRYTRAVTAIHLAADRAAGLATVLVFESSGVDFTGGAVQGRLDAQLAQKQLAGAGLKGQPVYFAIDAGTSLLQDVNTYLQGCCAVLGKPNVGVYGSYSVITAALAGSWCSWFWQTYAWSNGQLNPSAHLYQYLNSQVLGGYTVDLDRTVAGDADYGQIRWEEDMLGIFVAKVVNAVPGAAVGEEAQFLSNGMLFRWIVDGQQLADITGATGPWFNGGLPVQTWAGGAPVADPGAFGGPADPVTAEMLGFPTGAPTQASIAITGSMKDNGDGTFTFTGTGTPT